MIRYGAVAFVAAVAGSVATVLVRRFLWRRSTLSPPAPNSWQSAAARPILGPITRRPLFRLSRGLALWVVSVIGAFAAQAALTLRHAIEPGVILFAVSAVLVVISAALIERYAPAPDPLSSARMTPSGGLDRGRSRDPGGSGTSDEKRVRIRNIARAVFFIDGLVAVGYSGFTVVTQKTPSFSLQPWLLGLLLCFLGMCFYSSFPWRLPRTRPEVLELAGVLILLALAVAFRFPHLSEIPADVHGDEGAVGLEARRILTGSVVNFFGLGWAGLPELSFAFSALTMRVFGDDLFGLRLASAIEGTASVALIYGVAKRLFSIRIAAIAALILATSQMAVHYSRIGNNYISALFVSLVFFYFLLRGLARYHPVDFLVAGYAAGLAVSVYYPARVTLLLGLVYVIHRAIGEREFPRRHRRGLLVLAFGACIFFAPQLVQYARDPLSAFLRIGSVFVLAPNNLSHELNAYQFTSVEAVLWRQFVDSIGAFNLLGETSRQYGQRGPLFDFWSGALFVLGVALVTARPRSARYFLLLSWVWLSVILLSALTLDAMFSPHEIAILAVTPILTALVLDLGWRGATARFGAWGHRVAAVGAIGFVVATSYANYVDYFVVHETQFQDTEFFASLSRYIAPLNDRYRVYLLANADTSLHYDTAQFLIPNVDGVDVRGWPLPLPLDRVPERKGVIFVDPAEADPRFKALLVTYPRGVMEVHQSLLGYKDFYILRVEHGDLVSANPGAAIDHHPIPGLNLVDLPAPR